MLTWDYLDDVSLDMFGTGMSRETSQKYIPQRPTSFIFLLYIPRNGPGRMPHFNQEATSLSGIDHSGCYSLAHYNIFAFPFSPFILVFAPEMYFSFALQFMAVMVGYALLVINKSNDIRVSQRILRSMAYLALLVKVYLGNSILMNVIFLLTGDLTLQDFIPDKA